jgi:hypothetical protein
MCCRTFIRKAGDEKAVFEVVDLGAGDRWIDDHFLVRRRERYRAGDSGSNQSDDGERAGQYADGIHGVRHA